MVSWKRSAIMESLLKLLDERPLNKISVKDIVEDCGISRNTFYYHFEDMPSLIEAVVMEEVNRIMEQYSEISSMNECFDAAIRTNYMYIRLCAIIMNNRRILQTGSATKVPEAITFFNPPDR